MIIEHLTDIVEMCVYPGLKWVLIRDYKLTFLENQGGNVLRKDIKLRLFTRNKVQTPSPQGLRPGQMTSGDFRTNEKSITTKRKRKSSSHSGTGTRPRHG